MAFMVGLQSQPVAGAELVGYIALALMLSPILIFLSGSILFYRSTTNIETSKNKRVFMAVLLFLLFFSPLIFYWFLQSFTVLVGKLLIK